jgi:hypothetical protein
MYNISNLVENETITIPLEAGGKNEIAWGTLAFVPTSSQTINAGKLVCINGTAEFVGQSILYTLKDDTPTEDGDIIQFTVQDIKGNVSKVGTVCVTFDTIPAPVADDLEVCTTCYSATPFFNVGDFATGNFVPALTEIVTQPTAGTIIQNGSTFSYIQNPATFLAVDEMDFKLVNANGVKSNTATAYLVRSCLGVFTNSIVDITCTAKTFNLFDLLSGNTYINAGTWTESTLTSPTYISQSGTITNGGQGTVNFTSILPGVYKFKHSGTLTAPGSFSLNNKNCPVDVEVEVTIIHTATPAITHTTNTNLSGNTYQVNFTVANVTNPSTITVTNNATPLTSFVINPQLSGTNGFFVVNLPSGTNNIVISALTVCNTTVTTNTSIVI